MLREKLKFLKSICLIEIQILGDYLRNLPKRDLDLSQPFGLRFLKTEVGSKKGKREINPNFTFDKSLILEREIDG